MILVTVGLHNYGFERLLKPMDELASELDTKVIIQYGSSTYIPAHAECFQWVSYHQFNQFIHQANVVVSHVAAGSILTSFRHNKPIVLVPRRKKYGEAIDDHQLQLSSALEKNKKAIVVYEPSAQNLRAAIHHAKNRISTFEINQQLIAVLQNQFNSWAK